MRKSVRDRFEHHSILYVTSILVAANMFIFVILVLMDQLLRGAFATSGAIGAGILLMLGVPYLSYKREGRDIKRLSKMIKEDLFLMSFAFTFIIIGAVVFIIMLVLRFRGVTF